MSGWSPTRPSRPPWETQEQPRLRDSGDWHGEHQGPRVVIRPQDQPGRDSDPGGGDPGGSDPGDGGGPGRKGLAVGVAVGLVAIVGIAAAVVVTHHSGGPSTSPSALPTIPNGLDATAPASPVTPVASSAEPTAPSASTPAAPRYVLALPSAAGGYTLKTPTSAVIKAIGTAGSTTLMTAVEAQGGKAAGSPVTGEYLIMGDQALGYAGFNGTFDPATVISDFEAGVKSPSKQPAGPHGGQLACGEVSVTSPAASTGTACVWATATTVGMVEFFGGSALEAVSPAKAGKDALKFRDGAETAKGK